MITELVPQECFVQLIEPRYDELRANLVEK
jgi:hypothetical protein